MAERQKYQLTTAAITINAATFVQRPQPIIRLRTIDANATKQPTISEVHQMRDHLGESRNCSPQLPQLTERWLITNRNLEKGIAVLRHNGQVIASKPPVRKI
jgi:hypothetical protein